MKIIDCSIRDGGHINKWHFNEDIVKASYFAASKAQVDYFEIGYKNDEKIIGLGPFGYCNEKYIKNLFKSLTDTKLLCMIDAGKYTGYKIPKCSPQLTPFSGIRIAAYPYEAKIAIDLIESIYKKGYEVFFQLMAWSEWTEKDIEIIHKWKNKKILKAIYFADSFGSYIPEDIKKHIDKLKNLGFKNIGFHSHNNQQMAFANSLVAIKNGASYIDASVYGLGRGAGNLPIEILLNYLQLKGSSKYNVVPYFDLIDRFYIKLKEEIHWGYSLNTLLSGSRNIHPYYVDELLKNYTVEEIWNSLDLIKEKCPISYNIEKLNESLKQRFYIPSAKEIKNNVQKIEEQVHLLPSKDAFTLKKLSFQNRHKNKKFLIICNGPSIKKYQAQINKLIQTNKYITIGCNYLENLFKPNYHLFLSRKRFLKYISTVNTKSILLTPSFFGKEMIMENYNGKYENIEIKLIKNLKDSPLKNIVQQHVFLNVGISAILTAYQMGAKEIIIVGMDGYRDQKSKEIPYFYDENGNPENKEISSQKYGNLVLQLDTVGNFLMEKGIPFSIITPTSHSKYYKNLFKKQ